MYRASRIKVLLRPPEGTLRACARETGTRPLRRRMARIKGLWGLLAGVDDPSVREDLALVATAIQVHFANRVVHERAVVEFMSIRFRWTGSKTRRRLDSLVELGVVRCTRDLWRVAYSGVNLVAKGETERKPGVRVAPDSREPVSDEALVRNVTAAEMFHRPSERSMNPAEGRLDFGHPIVVQRASGVRRRR